MGKGGEWDISKIPNGKVLDAMWENLVLGMIGETLDGADYIAGARVVDKSKGRHCGYRLELWIKTQDSTIAADVRKRMEGILTSGASISKVSNVIWRRHKSY